VIIIALDQVNERSCETVKERDVFFLDFVESFKRNQMKEKRPTKTYSILFTSINKGRE